MMHVGKEMKHAIGMYINTKYMLVRKLQFCDIDCECFRALVPELSFIHADVEKIHEKIQILIEESYKSLHLRVG
jgi:hypothetical protein